MTAAGRIPGVRRIAVLRANALGDLVFALPALDALRAAYPEAEIVLLGDAWHAGFLTGRPGPVDRVEVVPPLPGVRGRPEHHDPDAVEAFCARMRGERIDLALQLHGGGANSNPFVRRLGARVTAGLRAPDAAPLDRWVPYVYYQHEVVRYLEVAALVGAPPVGVMPLMAVTGDDRDEALRALPPGEAPLVVVHPGATDPRRRWPPERFAAVGDALAADGAQVVVTGTASEDGLARSVLRAMRTPAHPLVGALSLGGLAGLLERAALVVCNDTGPLHLAAAVSTPTVGVFWCGNMINGAPLTRSRHRPVPAFQIHCPVCGVDCTADQWPARTGGIRCPHDPSFVATVSTDEVLWHARDLLAADAAGRRAA